MICDFNYTDHLWLCLGRSFFSPQEVSLLTLLVLHNIWSFWDLLKCQIFRTKVTAPPVFLKFCLHGLRFLFAHISNCPFPEAISVFGFLGQGGPSPQPWAAVLACQSGEVLGLQERFIPLSLEEYSCPSRKDPPTRSDVELLRKSLSQQ